MINITITIIPTATAVDTRYSFPTTYSSTASQFNTIHSRSPKVCLSLSVPSRTSRPEVPANLLVCVLHTPHHKHATRDNLAWGVRRPTLLTSLAFAPPDHSSLLVIVLIVLSSLRHPAMFCVRERERELQH